MTIDTARQIVDWANPVSSRGTVTGHPVALADEPAIVIVDRSPLTGDSSCVTADSSPLAGDPWTLTDDRASVIDHRSGEVDQAKSVARHPCTVADEAKSVIADEKRVDGTVDTLAGQKEGINVHANRAYSGACPDFCVWGNCRWCGGGNRE